jgi:hypothetical protein
VNASDANQYVPIFFGVWISLMVLSYLLFYRNLDVRLKRRLWPPFMLLTGAVFGTAVWIIDVSGQARKFMIPAVALITIANIFTVRFCGSCGKIAINKNPLTPARTCTRCNQSLDN